jgi:hypothetical protein
MAIIVLVNFVIVIIQHAWVIRMNNEYYRSIPDRNEYFESSLYEYTWADYAVIISSVVLLPAYLYSIWGKKSLVSNKYARAVLMLLPALFLIGVQLRQVDLIIQSAKFINEYRPEQLGKYNPFSCADSFTPVNGKCGVTMSYIFIPAIVGFFVIIEVAVTLFRGPLHPAKAATF